MAEFHKAPRDGWRRNLDAATAAVLLLHDREIGEQDGSDQREAEVLDKQATDGLLVGILRR